MSYDIQDELLVLKSNEVRALIGVAIVGNAATTEDSNHQQQKTEERKRSHCVPDNVQGSAWRMKKTGNRQSPTINHRRLILPSIH